MDSRSHCVASGSRRRVKVRSAEAEFRRIIYPWESIRLVSGR